MRWNLEHILKKNGGSILLEDQDLIVINKPPGLLVLPDRYNRTLVHLYGLLKDAMGAIFIVHRIDRETSGIVLFAKTTDMHASLNTAFEQRHVEKIYKAIVIGSPSSESGCIDLPLVEDRRDTGKMRVNEKKGKEARTDYNVVERFHGYALIDARPQTGRTHQIRVHLSAIGLPILADPLYSRTGWFYLSSIKQNYKSSGEEKPLIARTALHASSLAFTHPWTGEKIRIEAPLPRDMDAGLRALKKYKAIENSLER